MRLISKSIKQDKSGSFFKFVLKMEGGDDIWNIYNLINKGDLIQGSASRKISIEGRSGASRKIFSIILKIDYIHYDPSSDTIRIKGINLSDSEYMQKGQFQSIEIDNHSKISMIKHNCDSIFENRLKAACDPTAFADVIVLLMEEGIANIFVVAKFTTRNKASIQMHLPKKKGSSLVFSKYKKTLSNFYDKIINALTKSCNFEVIKSIVVASPGFISQQFLEYLKEETNSGKYPEFKNRINMFIQAHSSSGFKHSLKEVLDNKEVQSRLLESEAISENRILDDFYNVLRKNPQRAAYGMKWVEKAIGEKAVLTLLVSDKILRAKDLETRSHCSALISSVEHFGGEVIYFSSMHPAGESLNDLTGIAAILKFDVEDEGEEMELEEEKEFKDNNEEFEEEIKEAPGKAEKKAALTKEELSEDYTKALDELMEDFM